uniref:Uncharacterized protein n=1 Tax=Octopus bimaculoides TaxID=37653 RepID=A0A0L8H9H3_OCTBM
MKACFLFDQNHKQLINCFCYSPYGMKFLKESFPRQKYNFKMTSLPSQEERKAGGGFSVSFSQTIFQM